MGVCVALSYGNAKLVDAVFSYVTLHQVTKLIPVVTSEELQGASYFTESCIPYGAALHRLDEGQSGLITASTFHSLANQARNYIFNLRAHQPIYVPRKISKNCRITVVTLIYVITTICQRYIREREQKDHRLHDFKAW